MTTFMEINNGSVLTISEIREFEANGEPVNWNDLEEVVANVPGSAEYDEDYGNWRPVR